MRSRVIFRATYVLMITALLFVLIAPSAFAQSNDVELETSIRAALQADPRSSSLTQAEFDALVAALAEEAREQGVTASDIAPASQDNLADTGAVPVMEESFWKSDMALILFTLFTLGVSWFILKKMSAADLASPPTAGAL